MARPRCKDDLLKAATDCYSNLTDFVGSMSDKELSTPFDFSGLPNKTEAHWSRDKNVRDVLVHLYEWQVLMLKFVENNKPGSVIIRPFLPAEYSWKTYGDMNEEIWRKHQQTSTEDALRLLDGTHRQLLKLAGSFSDEELFTKKYYKWTGTTDLKSYFVSTLSSHYEWALKKLKEHRKCLG